MESVFGRYKNLIWLVAVLFLQFLGLAVQVKRTGEAENTRLIRIWAVSAVTPLERGLIWVENGVGGIWHNYFYLRGVRNENRQLKEQIEQMRLDQVRLREDAAQAQRLQALLSFKEQTVSKTVAAQVIGSSASDLSRIIYIDKGEDAGLKRDMAVITADGIVGKVLQIFPSVSQVLLINDQSSGVGVILEKTRLQGVLRGTANGEVILERVMSDEQVPTGERVLTSGGDGIFPKGLPVGSITKVAPGKDLFLDVKVRPTADLSKLEEVLVLTEKQDRQAPAEATAHVRAADILAQRLPSVPDKPADAKSPAVPAASAPGAPHTSAGPKPLVQPATGQPGTTQPAVAQTGQTQTGQTTTGQPKLKLTTGAAGQTGSASKTVAQPQGTKPAANDQGQTKPASSAPSASKTPDPQAKNSQAKTQQAATQPKTSQAKSAGTTSQTPPDTTKTSSQSPSTTTEDTPH
jgi:rod shape-determining protein MreC